MAKEKSIKQDDAVTKESIKSTTKMKRLFGFDFEDFSSWDNLVKLMMRPEDPSSLAAFRILFGLVMMIDIPNERGMAQADLEYGDKNTCYFPLFNFLSPLSVEWMVLVYALMFLGAFGIMIGFKYRFSCLCFVIPYWYLFFLDKTTWNNHSYLYGLIGLQLLLYDANRCYSIDGLLNKSIRNAHVPLWSYCILRTQIIFVYFIAGLKKCDLDWISGYSMSSLGSHWVFDPFKLFMTNDQVTLVVVHIGGLIIDLFVGFLMFFDQTRLLGTLISSSFHIMNSRMFNIGMFPYTMLASTTIFYSNDWPKRLLSKLKVGADNRDESGKFIISKRSSHCVYDMQDEKKDDEHKRQKTAKVPRKRTFYHKFFTIFTFLYIAEQLFLPYSHFITKGYNNWTNGLYGYSWDMMVHSWHTQHIKIHFVDKKTNKIQYINPKAWTSRRRWSSHGDMVYQYAKCIQERLRAHGYQDIELYMDVWRSMNHRFNQRQIDPRVNLLEAKWSPFEETQWLIPLLTELTDWRTRMKQIENQFSHNEYDLTFVADLPGLRLENYVTEFLNASVEVLKGRINLEIEYNEEEIKAPEENETGKESRKIKSVIKKKNYTLNVGDKMDIPSGAYHNIYTISDEPSSYLYIYLNETAIYLSGLYDNFYRNMMWRYNETMIELEKQRPESASDAKVRDELMWIAYNQTLQENSKTFQNMITLNRTDPEQDLNATIESVSRYFTEKKINATKVYYDFVSHFYTDFDHKTIRASYSKLYKIYRKLRSEVLRFKQSFHMVYLALKSIFTREDFIKLVNLHIYNDTSID